MQAGNYIWEVDGKFQRGEVEGEQEKGLKSNKVSEDE